MNKVHVLESAICLVSLSLCLILKKLLINRLWPAVWLMPKHNAYSGWPRSGEIDLLESRGNILLFDAEDRNLGVNQVSLTLHFGPSWNVNGF